MISNCCKMQTSLWKKSYIYNFDYIKLTEKNKKITILVQ